jgi:hypothetical protein
LETMIGIAVLLVGIGILWLCFALGVFFFTRTGREGMRIQRMGGRAGGAVLLGRLVGQRTPVSASCAKYRVRLREDPDAPGAPTLRRWR